MQDKDYFSVANRLSRIERRVFHIELTLFAIIILLCIDLFIPEGVRMEIGRIVLFICAVPFIIYGALLVLQALLKGTSYSADTELQAHLDMEMEKQQATARQNADVS